MTRAIALGGEGMKREPGTAEKLGQLIQAGEARDAIHIAVAPVIASELLSPGDHVGFVAADTETVGRGAETLLGIIDPYLMAKVANGQRCWLFLYPGSISSLKHSWTHPVFAVAERVAAATGSRVYLNDIADRLGVSCADLLQAASHYYGQESICFGEDINYGVAEEELASFWWHVAEVLGRPMPATSVAPSFRCAC